jgi:AmiR/NasT family two-component response regulator
MDPSLTIIVVDKSAVRASILEDGLHLQSELETARSAIDHRQSIDRAKGILTTARKLTEEEA